MSEEDTATARPGEQVGRDVDDLDPDQRLDEFRGHRRDSVTMLDEADTTNGVRRRAMGRRPEDELSVPSLGGRPLRDQRGPLDGLRNNPLRKSQAERNHDAIQNLQNRLARVEEKLDAVLDELDVDLGPQTVGEVFDALDEDELDVDEAAELLGTSPETVRGLLENMGEWR